MTAANTSQPASPVRRTDGACSLVRFVTEAEEQCDACGVMCMDNEIVWACEACSFMNCKECGPHRRYGLCPRSELQPAHDEVESAALRPPGPLQALCTWNREQVNAGCGATCGTCHTGKKRGSRMDRCSSCRQWSCSAHPKDERKQCAALAPTSAGPSSQMTLERAWGEAAEAPPAGQPAEDDSSADTLARALATLAAEPAPRTLLWVPRSMEGRVADIAIECFSMVLAAHAAVEEDRELPEAAVHAHLLLRALPELLLRAPTGAAMRDKAAVTVSADLKLAAVIRARLDRAELADWLGLARDALDDRAAASNSDAGPGRDAAHGDRGASDSAAAFAATAQLVAGKVRSGCVKSALQILDGFGKAAPTESTWDKITALVAAPAPAGEQDATAAAAVAALHQRMGARAPCRVRTVRRRTRVLRAGAEPGPSGWRNSHISMVVRRPQGAECLARWTRLWAQCSLPAACACLWTQAIIIPLNKDAEGDGVRPIALGEALLKLAEAITVDETAVGLRNYLEPTQTAVRTPGGAEIVAHTVRSWTQDHPDHMLVQVDLKNA